MGIYIKGMEMPKDSTMIFAIRQDGMVEDVMGCIVGKAIPVPPHGNLIDVNALPWEESIPTVMMHNGERWISAYELAMAPTIIPSSEGEE